MNLLDVTGQKALVTGAGDIGASHLEDLMGPVLLFASPASDYVTGQILFVDGGLTAAM